MICDLLSCITKSCTSTDDQTDNAKPCPGKTKKDDTLDQDISHSSNSRHAKREGAPLTSQPTSASDCMRENASESAQTDDSSGLTSTLLQNSRLTSRLSSFARNKKASGSAHQSSNSEPVTPTGVNPLRSHALLGSPSRLNAASLSKHSKTDNPIAKVWGKVDSDSESDCSSQGENLEYY